MNKNILHDEIEILIGKIRENHAHLKSESDKISLLELDLLLSNLRTLYEFCYELKNCSPDSPLSKKQNYQIPELIKLVNKSSEVSSEKLSIPVPEVLPEKKSPNEGIKKQAETKVFGTNLFDDTPVVADQFSDKATLHDKISEQHQDKSLGGKLKKHPVSDLKAAIGINEKFLFVNELFEGNTDEYNAVVDFINSSTSFEVADEFLKTKILDKYKWNFCNKYVRSDFEDLVQRRFL